MKERGATDGSRISAANAKVRHGLCVGATGACAATEMPTAGTSQYKAQLLSGSSAPVESEIPEEVLKQLAAGSEVQSVSSASGSSSGFAGFSSGSHTPVASTGVDRAGGGCVVVLDASGNFKQKPCPPLLRKKELSVDEVINEGNNCLIAEVTPTAITEMDVEVDVDDVEQQRVQQRSSVNSVRGSAVNDADLEVQQMTPMKRRRQRLRENYITVTTSPELTNAPNLQTPPDQIVEINSVSTTKSQKRRRLKRNTKLQLKLHRNQPTTTVLNKCSTESTSEFPVSSPSNPQAGGRKFPQRPALLKNTLPADALERNLALITAQRPQMTLEEKIRSWRCDDEPSDVEDVYNFDELFKRHEELKRSALSAIKRDRSSARIEQKSSNYDFTEFSNMMREFATAKHMSRDSNGMKNHPKADKPTTSAEAAYLVAQRRLKVAIENENKKRLSKERLKGKNSGLLPATSSSENEGACHKGAAKQKHAKHSSVQKPQQQKILVYDKVLCRSSSEEASQDAVAAHNLRSSGAAAVSHAHSKNLLTRSPPLHPKWTSSDNDSVFRLHRRHREIDKGRTEAPGLIQMRLDFGNEKKDLHLREKKNELFKTPTVPQKYLTTPFAALANNNNNNNNILNGIDDSGEGMRKDQLSLNMKSEAGHCKTISHHEVGVAPSNTTTAFHQQHEFCNYLGLTGMSTANAVANAVAELAKCKLARRSLRVRHLQQQGNKSKTEQGQELKDEKQLEELKLKQLREVNRREKGGKDTSSHRIAASTCSSFSNSPVSISRQSNHNDANTLIRKLALPKKEPEIKILCHISAVADRDEAEKVSKNCVKEITAPIRETLMRQLKHGVDSSYGTSTCPRSSLSEVGDGDETSSNPTPKPAKVYKEISIPSRTKPGQHNAATSPKKTDSTELVQILHTKFQRYLEASRKTKPSIFIVQSLQSGSKEPSTTEANRNKPVIEAVAASDKTTTHLTKLTKRQREKKQERNMFRSLQGKLHKRLFLRGRKTKDRLHKLLTRSSWNMGHQRQLRNRKIVLVKTIKRPRRSKANKSTQKSDTPTVTSEHSTSSLISKKHRSLSDTKNYSSEVSDAGSRKQSISHKKSSLPRRSQSSTKQKHKIKRNTRMNSISCNAGVASELKTTQTEVLATTTGSITIDAGVRLDAGKNLEILGNDNDVVVVSSTTNNYEEPLLQAPAADTAPVPVQTTKEISNNVSFVIMTKENSTQSTISGDGIHYLSRPSRALPNPLKRDQGSVDYIYYEMDVLIVVQTSFVSFWKYSKLIRVLTTSHPPQPLPLPCHKPLVATDSPTSTAGVVPHDAATTSPGWTHLGQCRRITCDVEIPTTYANRICVHNSIPIYVEMRCRQIPRERRDCNLLSMYINVYFYNEDDMLAKAHSIQLDAVQSEPGNVVYTTITESRYFVMAWPQENLVGKTRSGLCKYSLTPQLDTLASIREFKHMRHELRYLECTDDDKLLGFGDTQLTIWDHRSGDVLMNYDLDVPLGRNLGSVYYPSLDIGQNNMLLLFQYVEQLADDGAMRPELHIVVCCVSHAMPSYRLLKRHELPNESFGAIRNAISTGEHLIITAEDDEEIWVSCADPDTITRVPAQGTRRFYSRGRTQLIELTDKTLSVDSFANHVLKLAANKAKV